MGVTDTYPRVAENNSLQRPFVLRAIRRSQEEAELQMLQVDRVWSAYASVNSDASYFRTS
eukprot:6485136-Amphidinium_carterae.1